jgi:F-type H+-transporting ATPase subunit b
MAEPHATSSHTAAPEHHAEPTAFGLDAPGWIALAMVVVFALLIWKRVPGIIGTALDRKIAGIREQLDEAAKLRAEAEALKAEYEARAAQADAEAATMLERARTEAQGIVAQAEADASALVERRARMAEDKIAAAERAALEEVRARAASAAAAAAESLIRDKLDAKADKPMVDVTIAGLGRP